MCARTWAPWRGSCEAAELPDGRWALGTDRRAPPPRARTGSRTIRTRSPRSTTGPTPTRDPVTRSALRAALATLRRCLALSAEAGDATAPATIELSADPVLAGYQASAVAPLAAFDQQQLLAAPTPDDRVELLSRLLDEAVEVLQLRLGSPGRG